MAINSVITTVSLSANLRQRLDQEAASQRRSRSFVVAEAIGEYLERQERLAFSEGRERTLREGLALTPSQRVGLAEELWRELAHGSAPHTPWTEAFDTFDEYEQWRRRRRSAVG